MAVNRSTVVYKTIGGLNIELDIHLSQHPNQPNGAPILLYLHGNGSPFAGHRSDIASHMIDGVHIYDYALVSADYRLAPQVGIQEMLADVQDCIRFIRDPNGLTASLPSEVLTPGKLDLARLAVSGSGGGGYLALLAGIYTVPTPPVLCLYPITDPLGTFFITSQPWDEIENGMDADTAAYVLEQFLDPDGVVVTNSTTSNDPERSMLYNYMLHRGNLADLLHLNVSANAQRDPGNATWRVAKQIRNGWFPTFFITHGDADDQVDVGQSDEVVGAAKGFLGDDMFNRIKYETESGCGHAFDHGAYDMKVMYKWLVYWLGS